MNRLKNSLKVSDQYGQMLLFVLIVILLLLIILIAIITNVRVDIKETQLEREYEAGYGIAEEILYRISSGTFDIWEGTIEQGEGGCENASNFVTHPNYSAYASFCDSSEVTTCCVVKNLGEDASGVAVVGRKVHDKIYGVSIKKDETLEVNVEGATGDLILKWDAPATAMSVMLVCKNTLNPPVFENVRASVCSDAISGDASCGIPGAEGFITIAAAKDESNATHDAPLDMDNGCTKYGANFKPAFLRLRVISGNAEDQANNIRVRGDNLPPQMEEIRVQGFSSGIGNQAEENLSAPEVLTLKMIRKRVPSIFDYVLFTDKLSKE